MCSSQFCFVVCPFLFLFCAPALQTSPDSLTLPFLLLSSQSVPSGIDFTWFSNLQFHFVATISLESSDTNEDPDFFFFCSPI